MKFFISVFLSFLFLGAIQSQNVIIPDSLFKATLTNTLCVDSTGDGIGDIDVDMNDDGEIQISEALAVEYLILENIGLTDHTGLNAFENIISIKCKGNKFVEINIQNKQFLEEFEFSFHLDLLTVKINDNPKLTTLDLSSGVTNIRNLRLFDCSRNALEEFNFRSLNSSYELKKVDCSYNNITTFSFGVDTDTLICAHNKISNNATDFRAKYIDFSNNNLTKMKYTHTIIEKLIYDNNPLEEIRVILIDEVSDFINIPTLETIYIEGEASQVVGKQKIVNISKNENLNIFSVQERDNGIIVNISDVPEIGGLATVDEVNISNLDSLPNMTIRANKISISNCQNIERIVNERYLTDSLFISGMPNLRYLQFDLKEDFDSLSLVDLPKLDTLSIVNTFTETNANIRIENLPSLKFLEVDKTTMKSFVMENLPQLNEIKFFGFVPEIKISDFPSLEKINLRNADLESFELSRLDNLKSFKLWRANLKELYLMDLPNLVSFYMDRDVNNTQLLMDVLSFVDLPKLESLDLRSQMYSTLVLEKLPALKSFHSRISDFNSGGFTPIPRDYIFKDLMALDTVFLEDMVIESLTFENLPNFKNLFLIDNKGLDSIRISDLTLENIVIDDKNSFDILEFGNLFNVNNIHVKTVYPIDVKLLDNLKSLRTLKIESITSQSSTDIANFIFKDYSNIDTLVLNYGIVNLELSGLPNLKYLDVSKNSFTALLVQDFPLLETFLCKFNSSFDLAFSEVKNLKHIDIVSSTGFKSLDLSEVPLLSYLNLSSSISSLKIPYLNLKNGNPSLDFFSSNRIEYICVDNAVESESLIAINSDLEDSIFSDYCSFEPGGEFSCVAGLISFSSDGGNCNLPLINSSVLFNLLSDSEEISRFVFEDGTYKMPTGLVDDTYTLTPSWENSYFRFEPKQYTFDFDSLGQSVQFDFCLIPDKIINDLEVVVTPISVARPGFDVEYKIDFYNKGTTTLSGEVTFSFDEDLMDFLSAMPDNFTSSSGQLSWEFENLSPFEHREINLDFNLNSPMELPPLNADDIIVFRAEISSGVEDETRYNNSFELDQTIVNSFDPNDKTCLEGESIELDVIDEYLHYLIRFENTGSAEAINIVVKDEIDTLKFDLRTLVPLGSSHDYFIQIRFGNNVEFIFENINLPFDDASNDGYVLFKIKPHPNVILNDELANDAEIYFDFNFPIITNESKIIVEKKLSNSSISNHISSLEVAPNPIRKGDEIKILTEFQDACEISVLSLSGMEIFRGKIYKARPFFNANFNSGIYILKTKIGGQDYYQKLVVID